MKCINCSKNTDNPKFCCRSCGVSYNNRMQPKRIKKMKTCVFCKKQFHSLHSENQKYCNKQCLLDHKENIIKTQGFEIGRAHV